MPRVAVVGAGVDGLATTLELIDAGADVRVYESEMPGGAQSQGRTRVFRVAHRDPRLVELAERSRRAWRDWEDRFRRRLIGDEGLVISGHETVASWGAAMRDAGAVHEIIDVERAQRLVPVARPPGETSLFDPAAGATRARRTVQCLLDACRSCVSSAEVVGVENTVSGVRVELSDGVWDCDQAILTAGAGTPELAATAGIDVNATLINDSRFSYRIQPEYRGHRLSCRFDQSNAFGPNLSSYGQRVGSTGLYAVGVGWCGGEDLAADEESELHRRVAARYLPLAYPGLDPVPLDELRCTYARVEGLPDDGDGFNARRSGCVTALSGTNLFKFAPLLGRLLSRAALTGELPAELQLDFA